MQNCIRSYRQWPANEAVQINNIAEMLMAAGLEELDTPSNS